MAELNLRRPNGYDGAPATQSVMGITRFATLAEANAGTATNLAISPATAQAATALDFASPPVLGFGSTTPRPVHATTLDSTGTTSIATGAASVANIGNGTGTIGFFGVTAAARPGATTDIKDGLALMGLLTNGGATPLNLDGGAFNAGTVTATTTVAAGTTLTAGTTITATLGNITATNGNLSLATAGNKIIIATGANASVGTSDAMVAGAVTVATTACSITAKVFYCAATTGGTPGHVSITAQDGSGFTLTSSSNTETSTFNWWIINA